MADEIKIPTIQETKFFIARLIKSCDSDLQLNTCRENVKVFIEQRFKGNAEMERVKVTLMEMIERQEEKIFPVVYGYNEIVNVV